MRYRLRCDDFIHARYVRYIIALCIVTALIMLLIFTQDHLRITGPVSMLVVYLMIRFKLIRPNEDWGRVVSTELAFTDEGMMIAYRDECQLIPWTDVHSAVINGNKEILRRHYVIHYWDQAAGADTSVIIDYRYPMVELFEKQFGYKAGEDSVQYTYTEVTDDVIMMDERE